MKKKLNKKKKDMKLTSRVSFFKCFLISDVVPSSSSDLTSFLVVFLDSSSNFTFLYSLSSFSVDAGRFKAPPLLKKKEDFFISHIESRSRNRILIGNLKINALVVGTIDVSTHHGNWVEKSK